MIRTKKFENLPQITSISPSGKIVVTENGVDKVISFEDFSNLPATNDIWNNASTTFTAYEVNATDIQSAADSKLLDLKVNTTSKFFVKKGGGIFSGAAIGTNAGNPGADGLSLEMFFAGYGIGTNSNGDAVFYQNNVARTRVGFGVAIANTHSLGFTNANHVGSGVNVDTAIFRDAAGIIAQRNGVNAQAFRLYNTYTDATAFERLNINWDTNVLKLGTEKGSAGGTARAMELQTDATTRLTLTSGGSVGIATTSPSYIFSVKPNSGQIGQIGFSTLPTFASPALYLEDYSGNTIYKFGQDNSGALKLLNNGNTVCLETTGAYTTISGNGTFVQAGNSTVTIQGNYGKILLDAFTNNAIQFFAGTAMPERMRILGSNGNVGIGTTTPLSPLHISSGVNSNIYLASTTNNAGIHEIRFGFHTINSYAASIVGITTGSGGRGNLEFRVAGGGDATNAIQSDTGIRITSADVQVLKPLVYAQDILAIGINHNSGVKAFKFTRTENKAAIWSVPVGSQGNGDIRFTTGNDANSTPKTENDATVIISKNGGLVIGNSYINEYPTNGNLLVQNNIGIGTTTPSTKLEIVTTGTTDGLKLNRAADDRTAWLVDEGTGSGALYLFNGNNSNTVYITGNGNSYISSGNLGLGTNSATSKLDILDTTLAGSGSLAGSILNLAQTWNTTGAPTAIKLNVTNTASGAASNLLDLQVGGVSQFKVDKNGTTTINTYPSDVLGTQGFFFNATFFGQNLKHGLGTRYSSTSPGIALWALGESMAGLSNAGFFVSHRGLGFASGETLAFSPDTFLLRDGAANILAQRNGVNPQTFRLYNTYTDATTFERLNIQWDTNVLKIGTDKGSVGGSGRAIQMESYGGITMRNLTGSSTTLILETKDTGSNSLVIKDYLGATRTYFSIQGNMVTNSNVAINNGSTLIINEGGTNFVPLQVRTNWAYIDTAYFKRIASQISDLTSWLDEGGTKQIVINSNFRLGIGTSTPTEKLDVVGNLKVSGHFSATTKSFLIPHPTKPDKKLQYACLEGPENGVYIRGKTNEPIILLPDYWSELVDADSITVTVTPIGKPQQLFVVSQNSTSVEIGNVDGLYNYLIFAERKDVNKLQTEI